MNLPHLAVFCVLVSLSTVAGAQTSYTKADDPSLTEPKLPVVDDKACPGPSRRADGVMEPLTVTIRQTEPIFSTWDEKRTVVATLNKGEDVEVWSGVNVIREPNRARVLQPSGPAESPALKPGDELLGYGRRGDGDYLFWAKGVWFTEYFEEESGPNGECGFADKSQCTYMFFKKGIAEWWVQVKTGTGTVGWVLASKTMHENSWTDSNFGDLCMMD